jgi:site-specific DNA recombinase
MASCGHGCAVIVDGYIRVSQVAGRSGDSFISPAVQREQIETWAKRRGVLIAHVFEELDESGGRTDRPLLEQAIRRVERGESDGLVVAYLTRFGRSLTHGVQAIQRITDAGGRFVTVQEGEELDFSTDTGRLLLRFFLSLAEWELDRIRTGWAVAGQRAVARGVHCNKTPFGYRRGPDRRLEIHPDKGPVVTELFKRRAAGERYCDLVRLLMERGVTTAQGKTVWSHGILHHLFPSRVYRGEASWGSFVNPAAHPPLVDEQTWQLAQRQPTPWPLRHDIPRPLLSGILRCAGCQRLLQAHVSRWKSSATCRSYECGQAPYNGGRCTAPAHELDRVVEPYVEALFWQERAKCQRPDARLVRARADVERREEELAAYGDNARLPLTLGQERFARGVAVRTQRLDRARATLSRAMVSAAEPFLPAAELRERWPQMSMQERRDAIAQVIECAFVYRGRGPIETRLVVCLQGDAPAGLQPFYMAASELVPLDRTSCPSAPELRPRKQLSPRQLRGQLRAALNGWERWPSFAEFQESGHASLYAELDRQGGARRWAGLLGIPYVPSPPTHIWSDDRIRKELARYLEAKRAWPSYRQFKADGEGILRDAIRATGGRDRWGREMGIAPGERRRTAISYDEMVRGVAAIADGKSTFPARLQFIEAGLEPIYGAIMRHDLRGDIAQDLKLELQAKPIHTNYRWNDAAIRHALDGFLEGANRWPSDNAFRRAGLSGLISALKRSGARAHWAQRYCLQLPAHWDDESIKAALDKFLKGREHWPARKEFRAAGLRGLMSVLDERGTLHKWQDSYRLAPEKTWWNDKKIERALRPLLQGRSTWPSEHEFAGAGLRFLYHHLKRSGGDAVWAARFRVATA